VKNLGVTLDTKWTFEVHKMQDIKQKATSNLHFLKRSCQELFCFDALLKAVCFSLGRFHHVWYNSHILPTQIYTFEFK